MFIGCITSNEAEQRYQELARVFAGQEDILKSLNPHCSQRDVSN